MNKKQCSLCEGATAFHEGLKGSKADITKILFVAHKPDSRVLEKVLPGIDPYEIALIESRVGRKTGEMLSYCGLSWQDIYWTNIFKCVLPNDRNPSKKEYENCLKKFQKQFQEFNPKKIVALGGVVYKLMFPKESENMRYEEAWCKIFDYNKIPAFVIPHLSRLWRYSPGRREAEFYEKLSRFIKD